MFYCSQCFDRLSLLKQPLCKSCQTKLNHSIVHELCPTCGHTLCISQDQCEQPWNRIENVHSFHGLYSYQSSTSRFLKYWKQTNGYLLNRFIFQSDAFKRSLPKHSVDFIIPIGQTLKRISRLGHSPPYRIALEVKKQLNRPVVDLMEPETLNLSSQGKKDQFQRQLFQPSFKLTHDIDLKNKTILLVDDFMTTGQTLRAAGQLLAQLGVRRILIYVLAIRLNRLQ